MKITSRTKKRKRRSKKKGGGSKKLAIIVPYRDRENQLNIFSKFIHFYLSNKNIEYKLFIIEQNDKNSFNRAKLFNVGFDIVNKMNIYDYFVFHDVDLVPVEVDYSYSDIPISLLTLHSILIQNDNRYIDIQNKDHFGGVVLFNKKDFQLVNGFSNLYQGWGGEDDDMAIRVKKKYNKINRRKGGFFHLEHPRKKIEDRFNDINYQNNKKILSNARENNVHDGLNTLDYSLDSEIKTRFYTKYKVNI